MYVKILKAFDEFEVGQVIEVDDEDGKGHIEAGQAEATEFEEVPDLAGAIKAGIGDAVKSALADALAKAKPSGIIVGNDRKALDPNGGYKHVGQFLYDVVRAGTPNSPTPKRLIDYMATCKVAGHMAEGDDSQGGFLVPTGFLPQLQMDKIMETGLAARCTKIPMVTNAVSIPYVNQTTHATSVYGGLIVYRTGESELKAVSKPTFGLCTLTLHKTTVATYVSDELLEDSLISVAPLLGSMFPEALQFVLEDEIINGTGAGQGLGIILAPATITVARAAAGAIARADVLNMYRRLHPRHLGNAIWLANIDTMGQFQTMTQIVGTGGVATWIPPTGLDSSAPFGYLHGRPIFFIELAQTLGTAGDLIFADLSQMFLGQKASGITGIESSIHLRFLYDETTFKAELRSDNQPWWPAPLTPRYSAETISPFVILGDVATTTTTD